MTQEDRERLAALKQGSEPFRKSREQLVTVKAVDVLFLCDQVEALAAAQAPALPAPAAPTPAE